MAFCETKVIFAKLRSLPTSKIELFVTIVHSWKLLTSVASSVDPPLLTYDFQRAEEDCSNVASLVVYVDGRRSLFLEYNLDFNETIWKLLPFQKKP